MRSSDGELVSRIGLGYLPPQCPQAAERGEQQKDTGWFRNLHDGNIVVEQAIETPKKTIVYRGKPGTGDYAFAELTMSKELPPLPMFRLI